MIESLDNGLTQGDFVVARLGVNAQNIKRRFDHVATSRAVTEAKGGVMGTEGEVVAEVDRVATFGVGVADTEAIAKAK